MLCFRLSQAHIQAHIVEMFVRKLVIEEEDDIPDEAKPVVTALCKLYALNLISENSGDFLEVLKYFVLHRPKCVTEIVFMEIVDSKPQRYFYSPNYDDQRFCSCSLKILQNSFVLHVLSSFYC